MSPRFSKAETPFFGSLKVLRRRGKNSCFGNLTAHFCGRSATTHSGFFSDRTDGPEFSCPWVVTGFLLPKGLRFWRGRILQGLCIGQSVAQTHIRVDRGMGHLLLIGVGGSGWHGKAFWTERQPSVSKDVGLDILATDLISRWATTQSVPQTGSASLSLAFKYALDVPYTDRQN